MHCLGSTQAFPRMPSFEAEAFCFTRVPPLTEAARRARNEAKEAKGFPSFEAAMAALMAENDKEKAKAQHASESKRAGKQKKKGEIGNMEVARQREAQHASALVVSAAAALRSHREAELKQIAAFDEARSECRAAQRCS